MNDTYELIEVNDDGTGYVVFHWADGTSCGQMLTWMPVHDKALFDATLCDMMTEVFERHSAPLVTPKVTAAVKAGVGVEQTLDTLRTAAVAAQVAAASAPIAL